ncbi:MAG: AraC family transcriptional regulator [Acidobacteriota bacterium]
MTDTLVKALDHRIQTGCSGCAVAHPLASGSGWLVKDVVCTLGPQDHPFEEKNNYISIAVVVAGSFKYRSARGSTVLSPGSLLLGSANENFECSHKYNMGDHCISFNYAPIFFQQLAADSISKDASLNFPVHRLPEIPSLIPLTTEAKAGLCFPGSVDFEKLALELASAVLVTLVGISLSPEMPKIRDERRISAALRFMELNFMQSISIEELARLVELSPFHFLRTFKQVVGVTPHQFLLRRRLHEAALQLRTTSKTVLDIALSVGFGDLSNFNHTFHTTFGITPTKYRALHGKP